MSAEVLSRDRATVAPAPPRPSDCWHLDEMVVRIAGERMYLWRAVHDEGEVSTSWSTPTGQSVGVAAHAQAAQKARLRAEIASHREAALLGLCVPRSAPDLSA
jgi:hypothetical protein